MRLRSAAVPAAVLLAALIGPSPALALDPGKALTQYRLDTWSTRDGLPAHTMSGIVRTADGYLWFATQGLVRFDGATFTPIDLTQAGGPAPKVLSLAPSKDGGLWLLTVPLGLLRYTSGSLGPGPRVEATGLLFGTRDGGVWHLPGEGAGEAVRFGLDTPDRRVPTVQARSVLEDADGTLWFGSWDAKQGGLMRIGKDGTITRFGVAEGLDMFVSSLVRARDGTLWIGTRRGLTALKDDHFRTYTTRDGLSDDFVTVLMEDRDGSLWIGTANGGASRFHGGAFSTLRQADGLLDDHVSALHEDDEGGIWVGGRGALGRLRNTSFTTYTSREGLPVDTAVAAYPARDGGVWVSTYGGGLSRYHNGRFTTYDLRSGVPNPFVGAVFESSDGSVWFAVGSNQLCRVRAGRVEVVDTGRRYPWAIGEDDQGLLVVFPREGLFRREGRTFVPFRGERGETLTELNIRSLLRGRDGSVWVGSDKGLTRAQGGRFTTWGERDGVKGTVLSMLEDADGILWIATSTGLAWHAGDRIGTFADHPYLSDNSIPTVVDDGGNDLWFNSTKGLGRISKQALRAYVKSGGGEVPVRLFTAKDGLKIEEVRTAPTVQRACRSTDGRLWFPTSRGLSVIDPQRLVHDDKKPPLVIEQVVLDSRAVPARGPLVVEAGVDKVEIRYTALSYTLPERITFRYRLVGFDRDWVDAGTRRSAHYTKLPPGAYRFEVRAANSDGVESAQSAVLDLTQKPRFHQTVWFQFLLVLAGGLSILSVHRIRVAQLKARERDLAARVEAALTQIKTLHGLLPICAACKKIRDDSGYWNQMESYIHAHSEAEFSHSICPDCLVKLYPDYAADVQKTQ